jgi:hypothetical protein
MEPDHREVALTGLIGGGVRVDLLTLLSHLTYKPIQNKNESNF